MEADPLSDEPLTLTELAAQEDDLQLGRFDNDDAWALGVALVEEAVAESFLLSSTSAAPVSSSSTPRCRAPPPTTTPGSSAEFELSAEQYAAHGGAFPLIVRNVQDHRFVVMVLREFIRD